jgi:enoyl-CoA hydratase
LSESLIEESRDGVMVLTINRPEVRNALNREVSEAIAAAMDRLDEDPAIRVAILTGAGGTFSSGMDLKAFGEGERPIVEGRGLAGFVGAPPRKPLIAAVEGHAVAGGLEVAIACDLIVASRGAAFGLPETKRGLIAAGGGLLRLPRRMPYNVAMEMALTGAPVDAERAAALGIVNRLTEPGEALAGARELAIEIAANGPLAVAASKRIVGFASEMSEPEAWEAQEPLTDEVIFSEDAAEGARAFVEKRTPVWRGA